MTQITPLHGNPVPRPSGLLRPITILVLLFAFVAGACSGITAGESNQASGAPDQTTGVELWRTATLTDVSTGAEFRIADLKGKVVAIETMAIWCVNCRLQQSEARAAIDQVGSENLVYLSLDVDPNERADDLAEYARHERFGWRFAVAPREVIRSLAATFGDQVLSPPSTPLIVLGPDGQVVAKHVGLMGAGELATLFRTHLP